MFSRHDQKEKKLITQHYENYNDYKAIYKKWKLIEKQYRE